MGRSKPAPHSLQRLSLSEGESGSTSESDEKIDSEEAVPGELPKASE